MDFSTEEKLLKSEQAAEVLMFLAGNGESYGSEIAGRFNKQQSSISRTLRELDEANFIQKTKRTKAQYYKPDYEGIAKFVYNYLIEAEDDLIETENKERDIMAVVMGDFYKEIIEQEYSLEEDKGKILEFLEGFYARGLPEEYKSTKVISLESILLKSLYVTVVHHFVKSNTTKKDYLSQLIPLLEFRLLLKPLRVDIEDLLHSIE